MKTTLTQATEILGHLQRGDVAAMASAEIRDTIKSLQDAAGPKRKVKGSVTIKLNFEVQGQSIAIDPEITSKRPRIEHGKSMYFITGDGGISTEHPQQLGMGFERIEGGKSRA